MVDMHALRLPTNRDVHIDSCCNSVKSLASKAHWKLQSSHLPACKNALARPAFGENFHQETLCDIQPAKSGQHVLSRLST